LNPLEEIERIEKVSCETQATCPSCRALKLSPGPCLGCRILHSVTLKRNGCWRWNGATRKDFAYMRTLYGGYSAHRIAWAIWRADAPFGAQIEQTCGNHDCVNPEHLRLKIGASLRESLAGKGR